MHVLNDDQGTPRDGRLPIEKYYRRIYQLVVTGQLACIIAVLIVFGISGDRTLSGSFWGTSSTLTFSTTIRDALNTCPYNNRTYRLSNGNLVSIRRSNIEYFVGDSINRVYYAIGVTAMAVLIGVLNALLYDFNLRALRVAGVVLWKDVVTTMQVGLTAVSFPAIQRVEYSSTAIGGYLTDCGINIVETYLASIPIVALYVSSGIGIGMLFIGGVAALFNGLAPHPRDAETIVYDDFGDEMDRRYPP